MTMRPLEHRTADCAGAWSVSIGDAAFMDDRPRRVMMLCWTCGARVDLQAMTAASNDPGGHGYGSRDELREDWVADRIPEQHRPHLSESTSGTWSLPASVSPLRVAGVEVHVEDWFDYGRHDGTYEWLVTLPDGSYLGSVRRYRTNRGAVRFRWGTAQDVAGHGEGMQSLRTAAKRVADAVAHGPRHTCQDGLSDGPCAAPGCTRARSQQMASVYA